MTAKTNQITGYLQSLISLRGIIFGFALVLLIVTQVWVGRWYQEFGRQPTSWYPNPFLNASYSLGVASLMLLLGRRWSYLLALLISGWVIYSLGYLGLHSIAHAHDLPVASLSTARLWMIQKYVGQPQEFLQLALALVILCYAGAHAFKRQFRRVSAEGKTP